MSTALRFAVVTPVYNGGAFLETAMEAVQAQTYRPLIHVVLDNGSTDATPDIIARFLNRDVPVVAYRNLETLPAAANWSEAVRRVPADVDYFKILCADDSIRSDAIEKLAQCAASAPDIRVLGAQERWNNIVRPANLPTSTNVFEASNFLARIFVDRAQPPYHHLAYRLDLRTETPFFPAEVITFDAEGAFHALAGGGRVGWVHEPLFETLDHAASLTSTWTKKAMSQHWEHLKRIERYGPGALTAAEYQRVLRDHLMSLYRQILARSVNGHRDVAQRDLELLRTRGYQPSLLDYAGSVAAWPREYHRRRFRSGKPLPPWPPSAFKLSGAIGMFLDQASR